MAKRDMEAALANRGALRAGREDEAAGTVRALFTPNESIARIPTAGLEQNPYNSRTVYTPEQVSARALSLLNSGQAQAILVAEMSDGRRFVVDGWTRTLASRQLADDKTIQEDRREFFTQIDAQVRTDLTMRDLAVLSYIANEEHNGLTDIDRGIGFHKSLQDGLFATQQELATAYGIDQSVVAKLQGLATAPDSVRKVIMAHPEKLSYTLASEVIMSELQLEIQCKLLAEAATQNKSRSWLRAQVALASSGKAGPKIVLRQMQDATLKWSSSSRAKSLELVLKSKSDLLSAVTLLESVYQLEREERERLMELLHDQIWLRSQLSQEALDSKEA
jgi:ParB family chromosome partitioning protein